MELKAMTLRELLAKDFSKQPAERAERRAEEPDDVHEILNRIPKRRITAEEAAARVKRRRRGDF